MYGCSVLNHIYCFIITLIVEIRLFSKESYSRETENVVVWIGTCLIHNADVRSLKFALQICHVDTIS